MLDAGFMTDRSDFVAAATPEAKRLPELAAIPCLVLIGEPGLGKTTDMKTEFRRVDASLRDGDRALLVHLFRVDHSVHLRVRQLGAQGRILLPPVLPSVAATATAGWLYHSRQPQAAPSRTNLLLPRGCLP